MTKDEIEAALDILGWKLTDGPRQTSAGWRATAHHEDAVLLAFCLTEQAVLDDILKRARARAQRGS